MKSRSTAPWVQLHWKLRSGGVSAGASEIEVLQLAVQRAVRSASALFEGGVWKDPEKQREVEADAPSWKRSRERWNDWTDWREGGEGARGFGG